LSRGLFSSIKENDIYKDSDKKWIVELQRYYRYWYDLIVNPDEVAEGFDTRKLIVNYLKVIKKEVEEKLEKRFVYFICSRTKVRFNIKKRPTYNPFTKKVKIHLLIGKNEKHKSIHCQFFDKNLGRFCKPKIDLTDKYITLTDSHGDLTTASIHDFLERADINLGISSNVEYVGFTENPHKRPTNGSHTGLSDTLYKVSNEHCDTFIYFNIFNVITEATGNSFKINFVIPNSMTDEIGVELEGKILEKCLIFYFNAVSQSRNKDKELSELKNRLAGIARENRIRSISFYYEIEDSNDYGLFSSSVVSAKHSHRFTVRIADDDVEINRDN